MLKITIPLNPIPKKNSQRLVMTGGKPRVLPSSRFIDYQMACLKYLRPLGQIRMIRETVCVKCLFYRSDNRRVDLTNLLEAIDDVLVHFGVLEDDNFKIVASHDGSRVLVDKQHPRTEITITPMEEDGHVCP